MFVSKCRYRVFRKQKTVDACMEGFLELQHLGFEFKEVGFALTHVHFSVNIPKRYSVGEAIGMLKSRSAQRIFEKIPGFKKRYQRKEFWSRYEHHQSIGKDSEVSARYIKNQAKHHNVDSPEVQKGVFDFTS